jgi:predicted RNA methylase
MKKELKKFQDENFNLKEGMEIIEQANEKLNHALKNKTKQLEKVDLGGGTGSIGDLEKSINEATPAY